jgi:hypothetical protein
MAQPIRSARRASVYLDIPIEYENRVKDSLRKGGFSEVPGRSPWSIDCVLPDTVFNKSRFRGTDLNPQSALTNWQEVFFACKAEEANSTKNLSEADNVDAQAVVESAFSSQSSSISGLNMIHDVG